MSDWTRQSITDRVFEILRDEILTVDEGFTPQTHLIEAGLESLAVTQLLLSIEESTGVWVDESLLTPENLENAEALAALVHDQLPKPLIVSPRPVDAADPPLARLDRVPLTGADCFLRAFDAEIGRFGGASHLSQLVIHLGPGFDPERLRKAVEAAAVNQPILRAPVRRRFGVAPPAYRLDLGRGAPMPKIDVHDLDNSDAARVRAHAIFAARLNERRSLRRGELLRFDAVRYAGGSAGTDLAMTWQHLLFDGSGSERFVRWLDECFQGTARAEALPVPDELQRSDAVPRSLSERGDAARSWQRWLQAFRANPVHSLSGPLRRQPQALDFEVLTLDPGETERAVAEASRRAGFMTPMLYYLAVAIRAHAAVFRARGVDPGSFLVPLPANLRPRGAEGALFRTHVSMLWFQVLPDIVHDLDALIAELKTQRLTAVKAGHVNNGVDAMEFVRAMPARLYAKMTRMTFAGELCSFFFAFTGEFLGDLEHFLGAEIRNAYHVPPVPASPGSCAAMSLRRGRLNVTHVRQSDAFSDAEREIFQESLRADLTSGA